MSLFRRLVVCVCVLILGISAGILYTLLAMISHGISTAWECGQLTFESMRDSWRDVLGCVLFAGAVGALMLL